VLTFLFEFQVAGVVHVDLKLFRLDTFPFPSQGFAMEPIHEDCFVVFVRADPVRNGAPEAAERPLMHCPSYADARRVQRALQHLDRHCVIRYVGDSGGGD
jgi:DNA-binding transcriptional LysR family regulator